jgi:Ca-activated chloride channel family protein
MFQRPKRVVLRMSRLPASRTSRWMSLAMAAPRALLLAAMLLTIVAIARPQVTDSFTQEVASGVNVVLAVDVSESMETEDVRPNRLGQAKIFARNFLSAIKEDRCGLVVFAQSAFSYAPLTLDYDYLTTLVQSLSTDVLPKRGTAIGDAIAISINRLKDQSTHGGVIVILSDGAGNMGRFHPETAAATARRYNAKIYSVAVGRDSISMPSARRSGQRVKPTEFNAGTMKLLARETGGKFLRAADPKALRTLIADMNAMEKTIVGTRLRREVSELYPLFMMLAASCAGVAFLLIGLSIYNPLEGI